MIYQMTLCLANGTELPIKTHLVGELNQQVVIQENDLYVLRLPSSLLFSSCERSRTSTL